MKAGIRMRSSFGLGTLVLAVFALNSCGESGQTEGASGGAVDSGTGGSGGSGASGGAGGSSAAGGTGGSVFPLDGGGGQSTDEPCAQNSAEATLENRPVDIIFVIDNSGSMSAEIEEVEEQINGNFAAIIDAAMPPIDYRVVMLSRYGDHSNNRICVAQPLGGAPDTDGDGHCDKPLPTAPVNTSKFFHHSMSIASHNAFCQLLEGFSTADEHGLQPEGYGSVLRPEAFKFIAVITDDGVSCGGFNDGNNVAGGLTAAEAFDAALLELSPEHFGSVEERNYSFWSIVALAPYEPTAANPYGEPHPPDEALSPVTTAKCTPSAVDPGTGYQALSILTGGYRYPTCGLDYTDIFQLMALGVVKGAQVPCEFDIPEPPPGENLDLNTVEVAYSSGDTLVQKYGRVSSEAECDDSSFFIEDEKIILCSEVCDVVQSDPDARIEILFGCEITVK